VIAVLQGPRRGGTLPRARPSLSALLRMPVHPQAQADFEWDGQICEGTCPRISPETVPILPASTDSTDSTDSGLPRFGVTSVSNWRDNLGGTGSRRNTLRSHS
jgi:hypothetical protein